MKTYYQTNYTARPLDTHTPHGDAEGLHLSAEGTYINEDEMRRQIFNANDIRRYVWDLIDLTESRGGTQDEDIIIYISAYNATADAYFLRATCSGPLCDLFARISYYMRDMWDRGELTIHYIKSWSHLDSGAFFEQPLNKDECDDIPDAETLQECYSVSLYADDHIALYAVEEALKCR